MWSRPWSGFSRSGLNWAGSDWSGFSRSGAQLERILSERAQLGRISFAQTQLARIQLLARWVAEANPARGLAALTLDIQVLGFWVIQCPLGSCDEWCGDRFSSAEGGFLQFFKIREYL